MTINPRAVGNPVRQKQTTEPEYHAYHGIPGSGQDHPDDEYRHADACDPTPNGAVVTD